MIIMPLISWPNKSTTKKNNGYFDMKPKLLESQKKEAGGL